MQIISEKTLTGYDLTFPDENIKVSVGHLHVHSDGKLTGSLQFTLGKSGKVEPQFTFNFASDRTRSSLIKTFNEKYPEWQWLPIIDNLVAKVQELSKRGADDIIIQPVTTDIPKPGYFIKPLILKGVTNIIYGDKGVNKTTLCLMMLGLCAIGPDVADGDGINPSGLIPREKANVAMLDWENNPDNTRYTISRLVNGGSIPYFELPYRKCNLPLADDMENIGKFLYKHNANLVLIDSLGKAAGSDSHDSSGKNAALRFFECIDRFNIPGLTTLVIGQNSKDDTGRKTIFGSTFYTYYSRNIFRIQPQRQQPDESEMRIALIHEEANFSGKSSPIGFRIDYTEDSITVNAEAATVSQIYEGASQTKRILDYLKGGARTLKEIQEVLEGASYDNVRSLISKLKSRGLVIQVSRGSYGLPSDQAKF